jgi:hypothetical protein
VPQLVYPRLKKVPAHHTVRLGDYFKMYCGRETAKGEFSCGPIGEMHAFAWDGTGNLNSRLKAGADCGLISLTDKGYIGDSDDPNLGLYDLTIGIRPGPVIYLSDEDVGDSEKLWKRLWVCYHNVAYRERVDGAFEIVKLRRSANPENHRLGRHPLPRDMSRRARKSMLNPQVQLPSQGFGLIGARPTVPAVILCPHCTAHNEVGRPVFDQSAGRWYTAHDRAVGH